MNHVKQKTLNLFRPISLGGMDKVAFYHRMDRKFVFHTRLLDQFLQDISKNYFILEIDGRRVSAYCTQYYDTADFKMYFNHIRGKLNRYKIRHRLYNDTDLSFLEVKFKSNYGKTFKWRIPDAFPENGNYKLNKAFVRKHLPYKPGTLKANLRTRFKRITLVDKNFTQRITIDSDIAFRKLNDGNSYADEKLLDIAILEIKYERNKSTNGLQNILLKYRIKSGGFSKYCMGIVFTDPSLKKSGLLNPKILRIHKIQDNAIIS